MSQTITISAPIAMSAVPALMLAGGLIVGLFLRGDLATAIEAARLNAENDARTARWLFLRGYRKTPHAGPDLTPEPLALSDRSHADEQADHTDTDRPRWWATVVAFVVLAPVAFARRQLPVLVAYLRDRFKPDEVLDAENRRAADIEERLVEIGQYVAVNPPTNHGPDGQRHWNDVTAMHDIVTPGRHAKMPINVKVPMQRDGGDQ